MSDLPLTDLPAPVITIDGPSGVGKGTLAQKLAQALGFHQLDSGAIYRVCALHAIQQGLDCAQEATAEHILEGMALEFLSTGVFLNGQNVSTAIREEPISQNASKIAQFASLRSQLFGFMRHFAQLPGLIADGRDMGSVVFCDAPLKMFLQASNTERAKRRFNQLKGNGKNVRLDDVFSDLVARDQRDRERQVAPLEPALDAVVINTDVLSAEQVFAKAMQLVRARHITVS